MFTWRKRKEGGEGWHLGRCNPCSQPSEPPVNKTKLGILYFFLPESLHACTAVKMVLNPPVRRVAETASSITVIFQGTTPSHLFPPFSFLGTWALCTSKYREPMNSSTMPKQVWNYCWSSLSLQVLSSSLYPFLGLFFLGRQKRKRWRDHTQS